MGQHQLLGQGLQLSGGQVQALEQALKSCQIELGQLAIGLDQVEHIQPPLQVADLARQKHLFGHAFVVAAHTLGVG